MRTTSGLVLDVYDDYNGETLRELYPTRDDIPEGVKQAHLVNGDDRTRLPDDVFALVLLNNGEKLRKYACVDEGNTLLSVQYFLKHAHKLPTEAQQVAAENLKAACAWYDFMPPAALEKLALGFGTALTALTAVPVIKGTHQAIKENLGAARAADGNVMTSNQRDEMLGRKVATSPADALMRAFQELKTAETSGTPLMPIQEPSDLTAKPSPKTVVQKTAGIGHLVPGHAGEHGDYGPEESEKYDGYTKGMMPYKLPQAGHLRPTVDVTGKEAAVKWTEKKVASFALPSQQKYPLDSYAQVKAASAYFDQYMRHMAVPTRHEYATHLVKRAAALDIAVSDDARKYGSEGFAPEHEIKAAFDARRAELEGQKEILAVLDNVERVARFRMWKEADEKTATSDEAQSPDFVVELLAEFDKAAGLDHCYDRSVPDPYYSIYGFVKTAEDESAKWSDVIANEMVTSAELHRLAKVGAHGVKASFGADFQEEFLKDPVGTYKSLPRDQKKMLIRMANSAAPGNERTY